MKKYKVVDLSQGYKDIVGYADTIPQVKALAKNWCENIVDGAGEIYYYPWNVEAGKYMFSERKFLETY